MSPLAYLLHKADMALIAGHIHHALWLVGRARMVMSNELLDEPTTAAVTERLKRIEAEATEALVHN